MLPEQIVSVNLEAGEYYHINSYELLYRHIRDRLSPHGKNYVFLDEVQIVPDFQKACDSLYILEHVDLYITGSNAGLLSGELTTTLLSCRSISTHTVASYLNALCESFILYRVERYDLKGNQHLNSGDKYYFADLGLRYYLLGTKPADLGRILENVVYLELLRRGYEIYVGKQDRSEIDFIVRTEIGVEYYQVSLSVRDAATLHRELPP